MVAERAFRIDVQHLAVSVLQILADPEKCTRCLSSTRYGAEEQDLVDTLHTLLNIDALKAFRPVFLRGLLQFSKSTGRFPRALIHNDVVVVGSGTEISSGTFGFLWKGALRGQAIAMKVIRTSIRSKDMVPNYSKEGVIWSQLHHPNVVPFYGIYCWDNDPGTHLNRPALLSPWLDAGDIIEYLRHHPNMDKASLVLDIAQGLDYLHTFKPEIVHGDLNGKNILINSAGRACVANYGLSQLMDDTLAWNGSPSYRHSGYSSEPFTAPELLFWELDQEDRTTSVPASPPSKTTKSDVYSFGWVCYELYSGKPRFFDLSIMARLPAVRDNAKCPKPSGMSDQLWESVEACWNTLPEARPTMSRIIGFLTVENGPEVDTENGSGDSCSEYVWDGRPNPIAPPDIFQLNLGSRELDQ
ncbi:kinase-like domain-containing protein [Coprinopsis sp. MPI-PUGE-AT-0042]|nr:kinase-like domain-containing protein [Coprinopsis sp. MPI-PUGE-AT-0042]